MFLSGFASLFQVCFLPGFILLYLLNRKTRRITGIPETLVYSFAFSLLINALLVFLLSLAHIYTKPVMTAVILLETALIILIMLPLPFTRKWLSQEPELLRQTRTVFALNFGVMVLLWLLNQFAFDYGSIFFGGDELTAWNHWAQTWASNIVPRDTMGHYPQLMPSNWSLSYLMTGNHSIAFFAKAFMPLFTFYPMLILTAAGIRKKNWGYLAGAVMIFTAYSNVWGGMIMLMGMADIGSAFFTFMVVFTLMQAFDTKDAPQKRFWLIISGLLAGGAALTKQSGLFICVLLPALMAVIIRQDPLRREKKLIRASLLSLLAMVLVALPWYVDNEIHNMMANVVHDRSENWLFNGGNAFYHSTGSMVAKIGHFMGILTGFFGGPAAFILFGILTAASLADRFFRWVYLLYILVYTFVWGLFLSYDMRNYMPALPLVAMSIGFGAKNTVDLILSAATALKQKNQNTQKTENSPVKKALNFLGQNLFWITSCVMIALLAVFQFTFTPQKLSARQAEMMMRFTGDSKPLNSELYKAFKDRKPEGGIATYYYFLKYLPMIQDYTRQVSFKTYPEFRQVISDTNISYILLVDALFWGTYYDSETRAAVKTGLENGQFTALFKIEDGTLLKINRGKK